MVRYVAPNGADDAPGTSSAPWATLQHAADAARPGSSILVRAGVYAGFEMRVSGTPDAPITFAAESSERPVIQQPGRRYLVDLSGVHDVILTGFDIRDASEHEGAGVYVSGSSARIEVEGNRIAGNRSFGILIENSRHVSVRGNDISGSASGVRTRGRVPGTLIVDNDIHDNDEMIVNDPEPDNDTGGQGIAISLSTGPISIRGNELWGNRAESFDYGHDGSAFEVFGSSKILITHNVVWDNETVMETGTNLTSQCVDIRFTHNVAFARTSSGESKGILLRCAQRSLVAHNTLYGMEEWVLQFRNREGVGFAGSIDHLTVVNNILSGEIAFYVLDPLPSSAVVDYNLVDADRGVLGRTGGEELHDLAALRSVLGIQEFGRHARLHLADPEGGDVRPLPASPAIDAGIRLRRVNDGFAASAPDIGRYEVR